MLLFLYLAVLVPASYWVWKTLLPEMKTSLPVPAVSIADPIPVEVDNTMEKLRGLVVEKNKTIDLLQSELKISQIQVRESDKIKFLLEEEIRRLREQNRIFRSELGLPTVLPKKDATGLFL